MAFPYLQLLYMTLAINVMDGRDHINIAHNNFDLKQLSTIVKKFHY